MKILVTGANGFVGSALCAELVRQKQVAVAVVRKENTDLGVSTETKTIISIDKNTDWSDALRNVDVVIHLAARVHVMRDDAKDPLAEFRKVNVEGTLNLAQQAVAAGVKRFVFISTIGVNGNLTDDGHPFAPEDNPHPHDPYSISKYEAEQGLIELCSDIRMGLVIIRPPLIYGYDAPGNFKRLINLLKSGVPLPLGSIHNKRSFVYVGNLVSLILTCINSPTAANQVFLVSDGQDLSTTELLRQCASALGVKSRLIPVPQKLIEFSAYLLGKTDVAQRLCGNLQVDISKARTLLGWEPPFSVKEGLRSTADGFPNSCS